MCALASRSQHTLVATHVENQEERVRDREREKRKNCSHSKNKKQNSSMTFIYNLLTKVGSLACKDLLLNSDTRILLGRFLLNSHPEIHPETLITKPPDSLHFSPPHTQSHNFNGYACAPWCGTLGWSSATHVSKPFFWT